VGMRESYNGDGYTGEEWFWPAVLVTLAVIVFGLIFSGDGCGCRMEVRVHTTSKSSD
jgi:uncharacterized integral membrane protein